MPFQTSGKAERCVGEARTCAAPPAHVMLFEAGEAVRWTVRVCQQHHADLLELVVDRPDLGELVRTTPIAQVAA